MSTTVSNDTADENSMRWTARILSILWANWALFITLFAMLYFCPINPSMWAILIPVMAVALLMYAGAAIIASVWGKEKLGGRLLLVDGVLIFAQLIIFKIVVAGFPIHEVDIIALLTLVLPPLVAGTLFLKCHNKSNREPDCYENETETIRGTHSEKMGDESVGHSLSHERAG